MGSSSSKNFDQYKPKKDYGQRVNSIIEDSWNLMLLRWELEAIPIDDERMYGILIQWHGMYSTIKARYDFEMAVFKSSGNPDNKYTGHNCVLERCLGMMSTFSNNPDDDECYLPRLGETRCWVNQIKHRTELLVGLYSLWACPIAELRAYIANDRCKIHEQTNFYFGREYGLTDDVYERNMTRLRNILRIREEREVADVAAPAAVPDKE